VHALIAGGAGMVGSHLVDALIARGDRVFVLDNFVTGSPRNLAHLARHDRLEVIDADLARSLPDALRRVRLDRIYHLASPASPVAYARHALATLMVNARGTMQLLELARELGARFLLASTSEVYGDPRVAPQSETYWGNVNPLGPRACYDEGKRIAESIASTYRRVHRVDIRIARIFNTYGPRSNPTDGRVVPNFCVQALRGEPLTVYGDGSQTRSFCYVADLVRGLVGLMETEGLAGEVVNLGNPAEVTIAAIAATIVELAGSPSPIVYRPLPIDDPVRRRPDFAKARLLLGWRPEVGLREGLPPTLEALRQAMTSDSAATTAAG
jgi:UDP-glucuronate decarboxylase